MIQFVAIPVLSAIWPRVDAFLCKVLHHPSYIVVKRQPTRLGV